MKFSKTRGGNERRSFGVMVTLTVCLAGCSSGADPSQYQSAGDDGGSSGSSGSSGGGSSGSGSGSISASSSGSGGGSSSGGSSGSSSGSSSSSTGDSGSPVDDGSAGNEASSIMCTPALPAVTSKTQYLCNAGSAGKCDSCADCTLVMEGTAKSQATSCGQSCIGQPDTCITTCLSGKTPPLSGTCQTCLVALFDCTVKYCAGPCVAGTVAQCSACIKANPAPGPTSCDSVFLQCGGLTNNPGYTG